MWCKIKGILHGHWSGDNPLKDTDFLDPFIRFYECIGELIEYKLDKRIAEERQKVIDLNKDDYGL